MSGTLWGIGLGPGDPELITLKAARLIAAAGIVAYPALPGTESLARSIAAGHIREGSAELRVEIPMATDRSPAQQAYDLGAARIAEALREGHDVAFLCEGDPLFYGSFMYVAARLASEYPVEIVPGITSVSAATARLHLPLSARNQVLSVLPGPLPDAAMRRQIEAVDSVAVLKVGRHLGRIRSLLTDMGLMAHARYIERATLPQERAMPLEQAPDPAPYFSMIIVTKGTDPWL